MNSLLTSLNGGLGSLLLAGALLGGALAGCDPKTIGNETAGDQLCKEGETKMAEDGCNTCECVKGDWDCTQKDCQEPAVCMDGESMPAPDGCNTCSCVEGQWACTLIDCGWTTGEPMCMDGETKPAGDGCNTCTCDGGQWGCTEIGCQGSTGGAECVDGEMKNDGCNECACVEGSWACTDKACPPPACGNGVLDESEQCDDGNLADGDGCDMGCALEGGDGLKVCAQQYATDMVFIDKAEIVADTMVVDVQVGGGCETHEFAYCWDGLFLESFPVQIHTQISHDDNGDACEAIIMEQLKFDLTDLKTAYQDGYQTQNGEITIHLDGWDQSLSYKF